MGCLSSKGISANEYDEHHIVRSRELNKHSRHSKRCLDSSRREELDSNVGTDVTVRLISKRHSDYSVGSSPRSVCIDKMIWSCANKIGNDIKVDVSNKIYSMPNEIYGSQVAAGWPSWLSSVAGEAIKGWLPRKADSFQKLDKIGQGTYSSVYRGRDRETGKFVAMKKVRFVNMDPESVRFMAREILVLRRLNHPNVMKLEGLVTSRVASTLYLIFEYMEHDLTGLSSTPTIKFTESQIKCYMQQLLCGLEHCHNHGVLHRDIKGSNLLIDNNGNLKIGDFGLATFFSAKQKQPLTSRVVTLWYRPPELLLGATDYGVAVDLWSTGCILAELFYENPIMTGRTEVEQLHKIFKLCGSPSEMYWKNSKLPHATIFKPQNPYNRCIFQTFKNFPSAALTLLNVLLAIEPENRGSASSALQSEFFRTKPLPCVPSSLPTYPPSKEFNAKLRVEEAIRKKGTSGRVRGNESLRMDFNKFKILPPPDAEFQRHKQRLNHAESTIRQSQNFVSHSCRLAQPNTIINSRNSNVGDDKSLMVPFRTISSSRNNMQTQKSPKLNGTAEPSRLSNSEVRGISRDKKSISLSRNGNSNGRYNPLESVESSIRYFEGSKSSRRKHDTTSTKESAVGYAAKNNTIQYSGPLLPPGGNLDEMLKVHDRQIQNAVRKSRLGKTKAKKSYSDSGHARKG